MRSFLGEVRTLWLVLTTWNACLRVAPSLPLDAVRFRLSVLKRLGFKVDVTVGFRSGPGWGQGQGHGKSVTNLGFLWQMLHFCPCLSVRFQGEVKPLSEKRSFGQSHSQTSLTHLQIWKICTWHQMLWRRRNHPDWTCCRFLCWFLCGKGSSLSTSSDESFCLWPHHIWRPFRCWWRFLICKSLFLLPVWGKCSDAPCHYLLPSSNPLHITDFQLLPTSHGWKAAATKAHEGQDRISCHVNGRIWAFLLQFAQLREELDQRRQGNQEKSSGGKLCPKPRPKWKLQPSSTQENPINGTGIFIRQRNPSDCPNIGHLTKLSLEEHAARSRSCTKQTRVWTLVAETREIWLPVYLSSDSEASAVTICLLLLSWEQSRTFHGKPSKRWNQPSRGWKPSFFRLPTPSLHHHKCHQACFSSKMLVRGK